MADIQESVPEMNQRLYAEKLVKDIAEKEKQSEKSGVSTALSTPEAQKDIICDYYVVSTDPRIMEASPLFGIVGPNQQEGVIKTGKLPEQTMLEVNTRLGPKYFVEETGAITKNVLAKQIPSKSPFFVHMVLPAEKQSLEALGFKIVNFTTLEPKTK